MRLCSCCKIEKPETEFYAGKKRPCKECIRAKMRQYRERDEVKKHAKEYRQNPEIKTKAKTAEARNRPSNRKQWADNTYKMLKLSKTDY
jgi:hypothetical protein